MKDEQVKPDFMALAESLDGKRMEFCGDNEKLNQAVEALRWAARGRAQPVAWQERQRVVGGKWCSWYDIRFVFGQSKGASSEIVGCTEYEWRPLYSASTLNSKEPA